MRSACTARAIGVDECRPNGGTVRARAWGEYSGRRAKLRTHCQLNGYRIGTWGHGRGYTVSVYHDENNRHIDGRQYSWEWISRWHDAVACFSVQWT